MLELARTYTLPAALSLLPTRMDTTLARRYLLAIALQESRFEHRRQISGPARGFFQFERGGVMGVMRHPATKDHLRAAVVALKYDAELADDDIGLHAAIEHNDVLACVLARLNLWWMPGPLPVDQDSAWLYYLEAWRPGRPKPDTWGVCWRLAGG